MDRLRQKLHSSAEKLVLKLLGSRSRYRQWYIEKKDEALGRELITKDKFGNKYYQYYSFHGLPTRRVVLYQFFDTNKFNIDPHFVGWLHRRELLPPTAEELEKLYLDHDLFKENAIKWDREQLRMIEEFKEKKKEMDEKYNRENLQLEGEKEFEPLKWDPSKPKQASAQDYQLNPILQEEHSQSQILNQIDEMELNFMEEYDTVVAKELSKGQEIGKVMQEEVQKARYFFDYLRTQEKLYQHEINKDRRGEQPKAEKAPFEEGKKEEGEERQKQLLQRKKEIEDREREWQKKQQELRQEFGRNRYESFREEYKDIFEQTLDKKNDI